MILCVKKHVGVQSDVSEAKRWKFSSLMISYPFYYTAFVSDEKKGRGGGFV